MAHLQAASLGEGEDGILAVSLMMPRSRNPVRAFLNVSAAKLCTLDATSKFLARLDNGEVNTMLLQSVRALHTCETATND